MKAFRWIVQKLRRYVNTPAERNTEDDSLLLKAQVQCALLERVGAGFVAALEAGASGKDIIGDLCNAQAPELDDYLDQITQAYFTGVTSMVSAHYYSSPEQQPTHIGTEMMQ